MSQRNEYYPAKLLLFGEYTVLNGSQALAVPLNLYRGTWVKEKIPDPIHKQEMGKYVEWLKDKELIGPESERNIISDIDAGWNYQSTIPRGYGVGSSGALVAAVYDRYINETKDINNIHSTMAQMEAYFHGASSGIDPLISYTQQAVYKDEEGHYHSVVDPGWPEGFKVYLLDSGASRETGPLVNIYKRKLQEADFTKKIERQFIPVVEHALHFYLAGENKMLEECIGMISQFQREYFEEMIPSHIKNQWDELASTPGVYMKLCGAGGGGYFIVIDTNSGIDYSSHELIRLN